jgi:hypothetical protein
VLFSQSGAWVQYNTVEFGRSSPASVQLKVTSPQASKLEIRLDDANGPVIAQIQIPKENAWKLIKAPLQAGVKGQHHLIVTLKEGSGTALDWIQFE